MHIATSWAAPSNGPHVSPVQHHRQALGPVRPGDVLQPGQGDGEHNTAKKLQGLALGAGADLAADAEMGQELLDFRRTEVSAMPPLMNVKLAPEPRHAGLFGAEGRGPDPELVLRQIKQTGRVHHAPYLPGRLGDILRIARQWNQCIASRSSRLSDDCVQFLSPVWVVYL